MVNENNKVQEISQGLRDKEGWSQRQSFFTLKGLTVPGYMAYTCYKDAIEDPSDKSTLEKFFNRFEPTLLEFETV